MPSSKNPTLPNQAFLWVNHDAQNLKVLPRSRQQIFKHVQRCYRPWKRGHDVQALRESAKIPRAGGAVDATDEDEVEGKTFRVDQRQKDMANASPQTLVGQGNSDPFAALPVTITPEANCFLTFYRDYVLPATFYFQVRDRTRASLARAAWLDQVTGLQDMGTGYATLAFHGSTAAMHSPFLLPTVLRFINESMNSLRNKIADDSITKDFPYIWHMTVLFAAEVNAANLENATTHGKMLFNLQKQLLARGKLDYRVLLYQLYLDAQLSSMFLTQTIFDVESWAITALEPIGEAAATHLDQVSFPEPILDASIDNEDLQTWFKIRGEQLNYLFLRVCQRETPVSPVVTTWRYARTCIFNGRMVHHYLRAQAKLNRPGLQQEVRDHLCAQQYLALAGLWHVRDPSMNPIILGRPVYDGNAILLALRCALQSDCGSIVHPHEMSSWNKYRNARLWALYIGALAERAPDTFSSERVGSLS